MCFYNYISILIIIDDKTKRKYYQLQFNSSEKVSKKLICNKKNPRFYPRSHSFIFTTKKSQENDDRGSKSQKEEQERRKAGICSKMNIALTREPTILTTDNLPRIRRKWQRIQVDNQHDNTMYHPWDSCQELVSIDTCYHFPTYSSWSLSHQLVWSCWYGTLFVEMHNLIVRRSKKTTL